MRVAVFSDVHGNWRALQAVLADVRGRADVVVCAGDVAWGGPFPELVVDHLRESALPCVVGNTDLTAAGDEGAHHPWARWARERLREHHRAFLAGLPPEHRIETPSGRLLVVHSAPGDPARPLPDPSQEGELERLFGDAGAAVVVHGHDHRPSVAGLRRVSVVGTGAVGLPFDGDPRACYVIVTAEGRGFSFEHRRVAYDVEAAAAEAEKAGMPGAARWGAAIRRGLPPDQVVT